MRRFGKMFAGAALACLFFFAASAAMETSAWARAGGGGSMGSRGGRAFSAPSKPSAPSFGGQGMNAPRNPAPSAPGSATGGMFGRSPFMQGLAGGLAGGMLGSLLFGGVGHAATGGMARGGIGFMDLAIIGLLLYLAYRFFKKRRLREAPARSEYSLGASRFEDSYTQPQETYGGFSNAPARGLSNVELGFQHLRQADPALDEAELKENFQDMFFRVQAAWMNRSLEGVENLLTPEMAEFFRGKIEAMKSDGVSNRLENIAIRKVEPSEVWQENGRDFVTVFITASLLDYTVADNDGRIVGGDKLNPVKFQEFWTFTRDAGPNRWRLCAINQIDEAAD